MVITPDDEQGIPDEQDRVLLMQLSTHEGDGFYGWADIAGLSDGDGYCESVYFDTGCFADLDGDGVVGDGDLQLVIGRWGPCSPDCLGDVSANGEAGIRDLLEVLARWGPCQPDRPPSCD